MRYLLIMLVAWFPLLAHAVEFDENIRSLPLGREIQVFEDVSGKASIDRVVSETGSFRALDSETLNAGYSRSAFWLKVDLFYKPNPRASHADWLLELAYPPMDHVDVYLPDGNGRYQLAWKTGDMLPFSSRDVKQGNFVFGVDLPPGKQTTVYMRVASQGPIQAPLNLWASHAYMEEQPAKVYILGLIYGVLTGMLVYNLFIFISVRDPGYLYYILYIASFGLYQLSISGVAIEYLWPNSPVWANTATPLLMAISVLFVSQFSRSFLQTRTLARWLDVLLIAVMASAVVVMLLALFANYGLALRSVTMLVLACSLAMLTTGITAVLKGIRVARYFLAAWVVFAMGGLVNAVMLFGYIPNTFLSLYAGQISSVLEMALLSLALADRVNHIREQQAQTLAEAGKDMERLNRQLATSNRLKDEFLATLTHELRTPMNGVIGSLELMQTVPMDGELEMYQQTASASAQDMMSMINGILTLTELQAGVLYAESDAFDTCGLFEQLRDRFRSAAQAKGLELRFELDEQMPESVRGDVHKLYQCLECLLDNAIKFTKRGAVKVRAMSQQHDNDVLLLRVEVMDTGIGFSQLDEATLYQRFFQVDGSMTREYGGLGIGLAICRQLVELQGGSLSHRSEPGRGSCFTLSLPLLMAVPGAVRKAPAAKAQWGI
ncbi:sensor histidine kinase [Pseudomonas cichorii]|uniref:sensor histidine kinase n=1 Tax=Pseudomonas cichorii TaxID=36746 RepID=UPI001C88E30B|nr:sensor histidine kinase [Pseudomonas cichorii]MBX8485175.1 sensor histidine kinase [Pseudomonas cichorii]